MAVSDVHEAVVQLSLLDAAESGGEIVIARDGTPVARLVPVTAPKRRLGRWSGQVPTLSAAEWSAADQALADLLGHGRLP